MAFTSEGQQMSLSFGQVTSRMPKEIFELKNQVIGPDDELEPKMLVRSPDQFANLIRAFQSRGFLISDENKSPDVWSTQLYSFQRDTKSQFFRNNRTFLRDRFRMKTNEGRPQLVKPQTSLKIEESAFRRLEFETFLETDHCGISRFARDYGRRLADHFNTSARHMNRLLEGTHIFGMNDYDREMFKIRIFQEQDEAGNWLVRSYDELSEAGKEKAEILIKDPQSEEAAKIATDGGLKKYVFEFAMDECRFKGWMPPVAGRERQEVRLRDDYEIEFELKHHKADMFDKNYEPSVVGDLSYGDSWPVLEAVLRLQIDAVGRDNIVDINGQTIHGAHPWDFVNFVSKGERTFIYRDRYEQENGVALDKIDAERPGPAAYCPITCSEAPLMVPANDDRWSRLKNPVPFRAAVLA